MIFALVAAAIVPALMLMWFFHSMDVFREPPKVLWVTFGLGVLTIPGVLLAVFLGIMPVLRAVGLESVPNPYLNGTLDAFLHAAIPEELFKFFVLFGYAYRHKEFDEPMDGVVYGAVASLGFATLENVLYVASGGPGVAIMRALTAVPGHACGGAIMGYFVGQAKFRPDARGRLIFAGLFFAILLHGLYDAPLLILKAFGDSAPPGGIIALLMLGWLAALTVEVMWSLSLVSRLRREQLKLSTAQWAAAPVAPAGAMAMAAPAGFAAPPQPYAHDAYRAPVAQAPYPAPPGYAAGYGGYAPAPSGGSRVGGCLLLLIGGLFGAAGGLMSLGFGLAFGMGKVQRHELGGMIIATIIVGIAPLALGILLFGLGIRSLNRAGRAAQPTHG